MIYGLAEHHYTELARLFAAAPGLQRVLIFGSRAGRTARSGSDFDLAVIAPGMSDADFSRLWNAVDALPLVFKIDLLHWDRLGNQPLKENILAEGLPFYPLNSAHREASADTPPKN